VGLLGVAEWLRVAFCSVFGGAGLALACIFYNLVDL
jgi:hypothetical protein